MYINSLLTAPQIIAGHPKNTHSLRCSIGSKTCSRYNPTDNSASLTSAVVQQGKLWYTNGKDWFGNKQINNHKPVITSTLTHPQPDLWNICTSCRNTAELQLLINSLWLFFFWDADLYLTEYFDEAWDKFQW